VPGLHCRYTVNFKRDHKHGWRASSGVQSCDDRIFPVRAILSIAAIRSVKHKPCSPWPGRGLTPKSTLEPEKAFKYAQFSMS